MAEGEFPFRSFTLRSEGYDRAEVDGYVAELQREITELRRARDAAAPDAGEDVRLHDPEGAVTRTLAIAQETADRVLHDAQVEADRRRAEAEEKSSLTIADADARASKILADIETQAAEVREQGIAAARSAIQVERDKAMAELAQIRRIRDDLRGEAEDLKSALDRYRESAREAADTLGAAAAGPMTVVELPEYVDEDVALAGVVDEPEFDALTPVTSPEDPADDPIISVVEDVGDADDDPIIAVVEDLDDDGAEVADAADEPVLADVIELESDAGTADAEVPSDLDEGVAAGSGAFLAEVRAAADTDEVDVEDGETSDRFLAELREVTDDEAGDDASHDAADRFFDD